MRRQNEKINHEELEDVVMKPNPKRPQLWYQPAYNSRGLFSSGRMRILYPNGEAIYCIDEVPYKTPETFTTCCWQKIGKDPIREMRKFDLYSKYPKAEFLGNL